MYYTRQNGPPVMIMASDKYLPACRIALFLIERYWRPLPDVTVFGFAAPEFPLPRFASFVSLGNMSDYPVGKWSNGLIAALRMMGTRHVILLLEDYWLIRQVDSGAISLMERYMLHYGNVVRGDLTDDRQFSGQAVDIAPFDRLDMVESAPDSQYHMSLMPAIWNRDGLLGFMAPDWSPWQVELDGTPVLRKRKDLRVVGTRQCPIRITLGLRGGDSEKVLLDRLPHEDLLSLTNTGLLRPWGL